MNKKLQTGGLIGTIVLGAALLLAWVDNHFASVTHWFGFFVMILLSIGLAYIAWRLIRNENPPPWLLWLGVGAVVLRLVLGVFWYLALPEWGYDTEVQQAGYVMEDAYKRDINAWHLARADKSLFEAFQGFSATDQYGGLLFVSASVYRFLAGGDRAPILTLMLSAAFSGLGVYFTWTLTNRLWDQRTAKIAAWLLALYPEAVLMGSTQMREAFTPTFALIALFVWVRWFDEKKFRDLALLAGVLFLSVIFTPPFTVLLVVLLGLLGLTLRAADLWQSRWRWYLVGISLVGLVIGIFIFAPKVIELVDAAALQTYVSESASGWVARQFERMPAWSHVPFLVIYGIFRPLLPAALVASGAPLWRVVAIWRAAGWTITLVMLLYASLLVIRQGSWRKVPGMLLLTNWVIILVASYRGGGDAWDNPRYRAAFAGIQMILVAWAWVKQRETRDPWLRRALVMGGLSVAWFIPWYLRRYTETIWYIVDLPDILGLVFATNLLFLMVDVVLNITVSDADEMLEIEDEVI